MIQKYILDGNNLIGKIKSLWELQKSDKQLSRVKLVKLLDQYFAPKKYLVSLHFDGYENDAIPTGKLKIYYSKNDSADNKIKKEIDSTGVKKTIAVVSSDHTVQNYAKVNSCKVLSSEEFSKSITKSKTTNSEEEISKSISNDEMKKLFGA